MLFAPQPREPRTYAEFCLTRLLAGYSVPSQEMTDAQVREWLTRGPLSGDHGVQGPARDGKPRFHAMTSTERFQVWALAADESEVQAARRAPDLSGQALMNAVRELCGIWRPQ